MTSALERERNPGICLEMMLAAVDMGKGMEDRQAVFLKKKLLGVGMVMVIRGIRIPRIGNSGERSMRNRSENCTIVKSYGWAII